MNFNKKSKKRFKQVMVATSLVSVSINAPVVMGISEAASYATENINSKRDGEVCVIDPNTPGFGNTPEDGIFENPSNFLEEDAEFEGAVEKSYTNVGALREQTGSEDLAQSITYNWKEKEVTEFGGWKATNGTFTVVEPGESTAITLNNEEKTYITKVYPYEYTTANGDAANRGNVLNLLPGTFSNNHGIFEKKATKRYLEIGSVGDSITKDYDVNPESTLFFGYDLRSVFSTRYKNYADGEVAKAIIESVDENGDTTGIIAEIINESGSLHWSKAGAYFKVPAGVEKIRVTIEGYKASAWVKKDDVALPNENSISGFIIDNVMLATAGTYKYDSYIKRGSGDGNNNFNASKDHHIEQRIEFENIGRMNIKNTVITATLPKGINIDPAWFAKVQKDATFDEETRVLTYRLSKEYGSTIGKKPLALSFKYIADENIQVDIKIPSSVTGEMAVDRNTSDDYVGYLSNGNNNARYGSSQVEGQWVTGPGVIYTKDPGDKYEKLGLDIENPYNPENIIRYNDTTCHDEDALKIDNILPNLSVKNQYMNVDDVINIPFIFNQGELSNPFEYNDNDTEENKPVKLSVKEELPEGMKFDEETKLLTGNAKTGVTSITMVAEDELGNITEKNFRIFAVVVPKSTIVKDIENLSPEDLEAIKTAVKEANPGILDSEIVIEPNGKLKVVDGDKLVNEYKAEEVITALTNPEITPVADKENLTEEDKTAIEEAVKAIEGMPEDAEITVAEDGSVVVKQGEREIANFTPEQTVKEEIGTPEVTIVADMENLTEENKTAIEKAIRETKNMPEDAVVTINEDGSATVVDADGNEIANYTKEDLVKELPTPEAILVADTENLTEEDKKEIKAAIIEAISSEMGEELVTITEEDGKMIVKDAEGNILAEYNTEDLVKELVAPEVTEVGDATALTPEEQEAVKAAVEKANPGIENVEVAEDGTVTVDGKEIFTPEQTVKEEIGTPEVTIVADMENLTEEDKTAIEKAIKETKNIPEDAVITINEDGSATVVDADGNEIANYAKEDLVKELPTPAITVVEDKENLTEEDKTAIEEAVKAIEGMPEDAEITVAEDGSVVVKQGEREIANFTPEETVSGLGTPKVTIVADKENLTEDDKEAIKKAVSEIQNIPEDAVITVNEDGSATVVDADGETIAEYTVDELVKELVSPEITSVADATALTPEEQEAVKAAVEKANPGIENVEVAEDGTVTVDGKEIFTPEQTVKEEIGTPEVTIVADMENLTEENKTAIEKAIRETKNMPEDAVITINEDGSATVVDADGNEIANYAKEDLVKELAKPEITTVADKTSLTEEDKTAIEEAVKAIEGMPEDAEITVAEDGSVVVKQGEREIANFTPEETVKEAAETELNAPEKVEVADKTALTPEEQEAVKEAVEKANPGIENVEVAEDGTVTVDGKEVFTPEQTVKEEGEEAPEIEAPNATKVLDTENLTDAEKEAIKEKIMAKNPGVTADEIEVAANGEATVTTDGEEKVFAPSITISPKSIRMPAITIVEEKDELTEDEMSKVKDAVIAANEGLDPEKVTVEPDGTVIVAVSGEETVFEKEDTVKEENKLNQPAKTIVADETALTPEEQEAVKAAVEEANPGMEVEVAEDGTVTSDGEVVFTPAQTVKEDEKEKDGINKPSITIVGNKTELTEDEMSKVKDAVIAANEGLDPEKVTVEPDGTVTVETEDGEVVFTPEETVDQKINEPSISNVYNDENLTPEEQEAVKAAVEEANPGMEVEVAEDGTVTVDGKVLFTPAQTVREIPVEAPAIITVADETALTPEEQEAVKTAVEEANPGIENVEVAEDGTVTVDGKVIFTPEDTIKEEEKETPVTPVKPGGGGGGSHSNNGGGGSNSKPDHRISGKDRIETAVEVSKNTYPNGSDVVIIVNMEKFADVLTATPFAVHINAPILFVHKDSVPAETMAEIKRLGATKVYIAGGEASVSKKVADNFSNTHRFNGEDRYETAKLIAEKMRETGNRKIVEVASGELFADALSVSALAVRDDAPILLVEKNNMTAPTIKALTEWTDVERVNVAGYHATVSQEVEKSLGAINNSLTFRYGGADRYETSAIIAKEARPDSKFAVYTSGEVFADALVAAPYAGRRKAPVLLVTKTDVPTVIKTYTEGSKIRDFKLVGGENTVKQTVIEKILKITK